MPYILSLQRQEAGERIQHGGRPALLLLDPCQVAVAGVKLLQAAGLGFRVRDIVLVELLRAVALGLMV